MIRIGHFSDPHIDPRRPQAAQRLTAAVDFLARCEGLDAILCTGDRTADGSEDQVAQFEELTAPLPGLVTVRGNHDARGGEPSEAPQAVDLGEARLLALDSSIPTFDDGLVGRRQLAWLEEELARDARPTLIALHHPPVAIRTVADTWPLQDAEGFAEVVRSHRHVAGVLAGHAHSATTSTMAGVPVAVCPALINHAMVPEEGSGALDTWPPLVMIHYLDDGRLITHVRALP